MSDLLKSLEELAKVNGLKWRCQNSLYEHGIKLYQTTSYNGRDIYGRPVFDSPDDAMRNFLQGESEETPNLGRLEAKR